MSIAVYAGSFDPVTLGHLSVIRQAARMHGHLVVLVAVNPAKRGLFSIDERVEFLRAATARYPNVTCDSTTGLVAEYAREIGASVLVRGIRGATDAEFETQLAQQNRTIAPDLSTVLLPAEAELATVSSSALKEMAERGEDIAAWCPPVVAERLRRLVRGAEVAR